MIKSAHLGNGLAIWREGENKFTAHISRERKVTLYKEHNFTKEEIEEIEHLAKTDNRNVSITQSEKVFKR